MRFNIEDNCVIRGAEHVALVVNMTAYRRGDIVAKLTSPSNTTVSILEGSRFDISWDGFENQSILSLATWGENPTGEWRLDMFHRSENLDSNSRPFTLSGARLEIYGTTSNQPAQLKKDSLLHAALYGKL